jgi:hypothetical protein
MKQLTSSKTIWRWFVLVVYLGILFWMGFEKLHRSHPAIFFGALAILTIFVMITYRYLYRGEKKV